MNIQTNCKINGALLSLLFRYILLFSFFCLCLQCLLRCGYHPTLTPLSALPLCLQAMIRGELEVLKDWCYEAVSTFFIDQFIDYSFGHRLKMNWLFLKSCKCRPAIVMLRFSVIFFPPALAVPNPHLSVLCVDLQPAGPPHSTGQGYGPALPL